MKCKCVEVDEEKNKDLHAKSLWKEQKEVLLKKAQKTEIFRKICEKSGNFSIVMI